ncbi:MAG TPA: ATPase, partial [Porphyromonadaceae bacterium]|nr:ATPase [Porphyromonadaceae bacterium]
MDRTAIEQLIEWKGRKNRKPLVVRGARQVGKTWLLKEFAKLYYEKTVYINFEKNELAKKLFEQDFDIRRILKSVSLMEDVDIDEQTLLIFDEIQEAPRGITSLKYFY